LARTAYALLGPTASGKSALALKVAERQRVEIVSLDSALVYRGMDIGTAKPSPELLAQVPHHLIDIIDPDQSYSAGRWREDAIRTALEIFERNRTPLLVGGTMLYYRALIAGLDSLPQADARIRAELDADAAQRGWPALHAELARVDPLTAARLAPNDAQRIQRALEVYYVTGSPISALQGRRDAASLGPSIAIALVPPERAALHAAIAARFDAMLAAGLVDEVRGLRARYALDPAMPSMRCVGYRQAWQYLEGHIDAEGLRASGIAATRQLAKRQLTWLRSTAATTFVPGDPAIVDFVARRVTLGEQQGTMQ